ncbi:peptide-methionine (S)-S-oxide reductase [Faunimonas pinastri]|uniref:Peptide methionine sulfoxide reductase MsrA n=2 Tax=Faunimonas pinastri TaxID=1855383 RepID=A0A1H9FW42_9HYPH|nr:peptide-methionine (S)-S-oxide reductase [Faunimonas pinastri]
MAKHMSPLSKSRFPKLVGAGVILPVVAGALMTALSGSLAAPPAFAAPAAVVPPPAQDLRPARGLQTAVLAGGCFWGVQGVFEHVKGVRQAVDGYTGGSTASPTYEQVSSGRTGHAEAVEITYDPRQISYGEILRIFFSVAHDPTEKNRQGPDSGTQYRSAIFTTGPEQAKVARAYIAQLDGAKAFSRPVATEVAPLGTFWRAENYHQDYETLHPDAGYIVVNDAPMIANLKNVFPDRFRADPVQVQARAAAR